MNKQITIKTLPILIPSQELKGRRYFSEQIPGKHLQGILTSSPTLPWRVYFSIHGKRNHFEKIDNFVEGEYEFFVPRKD